MIIQDYLKSVNKKYKSGISREHSYRGDFENLFRGLIDGVEITNEPANVTNCGNPDYVITKGNIPIGYIEAKDIGKDLNSKSYKEQFSRYKKALDNLIITDYIRFQFFQNGNLVHEIKIAEFDDEIIKPIPDNFLKFENLLYDFAAFIGQTIKSSKKLAEMMAGKARLLQNILERAVTSDEETHENTSLQIQYSTFKQVLIHDLTPKAFADIYAQTLAYGMFAARLHDPTLENFSRQEAAELIPKSNPFLRKLFGYVAGPDIDGRIKTTVDNLADVYRATNVGQLLKNFGASTQQNDPIIHFYETFLAEYDPKLRKSRGVWYTPEPVVKFIVRAVDDILKTEFELTQGLADTSKTRIKVKVLTKATSDRRSKIKEVEVEKEVHKVQILDPATGTGTFLAEVIKYIYSKRFKSMQGAWSRYVEDHLIPRLNGFELLMASYAMAHLKLDMLLTETGFKSSKNQRFNVFLTNSLEEYHPDTGTLFSSWLSSEANEANHIKRDTPVMCIIGNPPYSGESVNRGDWIMELMQDYKKEPGGKEKLKERNSKWINGDENKFIRYSQHYIEKNGSGILAFINPHGYLDNPTFRGMRWNLLKTYDKIYVIDLHGNSKKKETCPDGSSDFNVFDIQQGVCINILIKTGEKKENELGKVYHFDLFGKREAKYKFLIENSLKSIAFKNVNYRSPMYFFVQKNYQEEEQYMNGFLCNELFPVHGNGMTTAHDNFVIKDTKEELLEFYKEFQEAERDAELLHSRFQVKKKKGWNILDGYDNIKDKPDLEEFIKPVSYRPFDDKYIFYEDKLVWRTVRKVMDNYNLTQNLGLIIGRQGHVVGQMQWNLCFVTNKMTDFNFYYRGGGVSFPLYRIEKESELFGSNEKILNLNQEIVDSFSKKTGLIFSEETNENQYTPVNLLDYIYAILHSPSYRDKYKEFLKSDFPRIPYPKNKNTFWKLVELGGSIRQLHLLSSSNVDDYITSYPQDGDNTITSKIGKNDWVLFDEDNQLGRIWINDKQYFDKIPLVAWEFYIGGYQPAQKWLKDRKGRTLNFDDILHYQKIIVALSETDRLMKEIDKIEIE
ncbi:DNA methyltransferase [Lewinellaceae bacterium SD302]|nr:DNA methyltransferase [Lewinellaceae bacterium SD302]